MSSPETLARRRLLLYPEIVVIFLMMILMLLVVLLDEPLSGQIVAFGIFSLAGTVLLFLVVVTGHHRLLVLLDLFLYFLAAGVAVKIGLNELMALACCACLTLFVSNLMRLNFGRRREAELPSSLAGSTLLATLAVSLASLLSVGLIVAMENDSAERSWIWVPIVIAVLVGSAVIGVFLINRSPARSNEKHWKAGESMLPPPTAE